MALRVVGAGLGRTGTASLKLALEQLLGGKCHHMFEVEENRDQIPIWTAAANGTMPDWNQFLTDYVALVDWPGASFWPELSRAFPDALVLLSVRDPEGWYKSASETIFKDDPEEGSSFDEMWSTIIRTRFCDDLGNKEKAIAAMHAHNEAVEAAMPEGRLLRWQAGDGWEPICKALGVPAPDTPFPHTNTKKQFLAKNGVSERGRDGAAV